MNYQFIIILKIVIWVQFGKYLDLFTSVVQYATKKIRIIRLTKSRKLFQQSIVREQMLPIISQLKKPNQILKSMTLRMVPSPQVLNSVESQNTISHDEKREATGDEDCSHILAQISSTQLKVYKIMAQEKQKEVSLDFVSTMQFYSKIYFMDKVRDQQRDYAFILAKDFSVNLLGLDAPYDQNNDVKVVSYMPLDNLDVGITQLINLEKHVTHFAYHSAQSKSRIIMTFEGSDWLLVIHLKHNDQGQLEFVDFELDQIDGLKNAIDITSCSASQMKGWPDESCQWLVFTMTRLIAPYNFSRDVMLNKNYKYQKEKLIKRKQELCNKIQSGSANSLDVDITHAQQTSIYENERKQLSEVEKQLEKLKSSFEDVASDDDGDKFAEAFEEGEQQIMRVYRYGSPNFEQQQEMQIELVQTSNFIFDFEEQFSNQNLFVKFITINSPMADRSNINSTILITTSQGLFYLDLVDRKQRHVRIEGGQGQRSLVHTDLLPLWRNYQNQQIICIIQSENIFQVGSNQQIDVCSGNSMVVIDQSTQDKNEIAPVFKVYRENQAIISQIFNLKDYYKLAQFCNIKTTLINKYLTNVITVSYPNCDLAANSSLEPQLLPELGFYKGDMATDDTYLNLGDTKEGIIGCEVLDVQIVNDSQNGSIMYHGSQQVCFQSIDYSFATESTIKFENAKYLDSLKIIELSSNSSIMLANVFNQEGCADIGVFYGQKWDQQAQSSFEFRLFYENQLSDFVKDMEASNTKDILIWLDGQLRDLRKPPDSQQSSLIHQAEFILVDFYLRNDCVVLITNNSVRFMNYKTKLDGIQQLQFDCLLVRKDNENRIAILDQHNQVILLSYQQTTMQDPSALQSFVPRNQTIRVSFDQQIHDICIHGSLCALIFFNSAMISFFEETTHLFDIDLQTILPFDTSQIHTESIQINTFSSNKEQLFMTICLANGQVAKFLFNPQILQKLQMIKDKNEKNRLLSISLIKFIGLQKLGRFVKSCSDNLFVNDRDELYTATLRQHFDIAQATLHIQRVTTSDISNKSALLPPYSPVLMRNQIQGIVSICRINSNQRSSQRHGLLIKDTLTRSLNLQIGQVVNGDNTQQVTKLPPYLKIQKAKPISKLNLVALCCYRQLSDLIRYQTKATQNMDCNPEFDNLIFLLNSRSGERLSEPKRLPQSQIPQHIEYLEEQELFFVGVNLLDSSINAEETKRQVKESSDSKQLKRVTCKIMGFDLFNKDGIIGLYDVLKLKFRQGTIMDIKHFKWFDNQPHLAVAIHNYIQIYRVSVFELADSKKVKLVPVLKIEQQIGVFKIDIKLNYQSQNKFMEILVSDVLKSLVVYQVDYDDPSFSDDFEEQMQSARIKSPSFTDKLKDSFQTKILRRKSMLEGDEARDQAKQMGQVAWQRHKIKYRFPYGQWCTNSVKVNGLKDDLATNSGQTSYNLYASSFFDENIVIMSGLRAENDEVDSFGSHNSKMLQVVAASNIQDQITSIFKKPTKHQNKYQPANSTQFINSTVANYNQDQSTVFISTVYLQNYQLPTKLKSSFFDMTSKFSDILQQAACIQSNPELIFSTSSSGIFNCNFCSDQRVNEILSATQEALSDVLSFNNYLTAHAQRQLAALQEDKIAFYQKFQSFQDGKARGVSSQILDLNEFLGVKKKDSSAKVDDDKYAQNIVQSSNSMAEISNSIMRNPSQQIDPKVVTFLRAHKSSIHGLSQVATRPVIFADFLGQLLRLPFEEQEKVTFRVRDMLAERQSLMQNTEAAKTTKLQQLVDIEVRQLVGLVATVIGQV